jgi:branched-chain amino acid transport system permease protein
MIFWLAALVCVLGFPFVFSDGASTTIGFFTLVFAAAGVAWNIFSGYSGYIALGHAVFMGMGAYSLAIMCSHWHVPGGYLPFALLPVAGLVAAITAIPLGIVALRTRRHTFIVITIAYLFIFQLLAENNLLGLSGGQGGLEYPIPPWSGAAYNIPFYYVMVAILVVAVIVSWLVRHSKYGLELLAIRDDEDRALGLGVRTTAIKLSAFTLSAFFVGMCGAIYFYFIESVYPTNGFSAFFDVQIALMAFLGGLGTISGPLLGALIIIPSQQYLTVYFSQTNFLNLANASSGLYLVMYGIVFLAIILLLPQGIVPAVSEFIRNRIAARDGAQLASGPPPPSAAPTPAQPTGRAASAE